MLITITVSDLIVREAATRGMAVSEFVESLIDKGMIEAERAKASPVLSNAMERIRALRSGGAEGHR